MDFYFSLHDLISSLVPGLISDLNLIYSFVMHRLAYRIQLQFIYKEILVPILNGTYTWEQCSLGAQWNAFRFRELEIRGVI
jgi:hypothetical protein